MNSFKESPLIQSILNDNTKELKVGEFTNSKIPDGFRYLGREPEDEKEKERILQNKVMLGNNFECYLEATDHNLTQGFFNAILTQDNITYLVEISWQDIIRGMSRANGRMYNNK